jgi:hypothetical protein
MTLVVAYWAVIGHTLIKCRNLEFSESKIHITLLVFCFLTVPFFNYYFIFIWVLFIPFLASLDIEILERLFAVKSSRTR